MVAACEADAARGRPPGVRMDDRGTWDRATWNRYLAAATRMEPQFGPPMHRLLRDIDRLQRLLSLITALEAQTQLRRVREMVNPQLHDQRHPSGRCAV